MKWNSQVNVSVTDLYIIILKKTIAKTSNDILIKSLGIFGLYFYFLFVLGNISQTEGRSQTKLLG